MKNVTARLLLIATVLAASTTPAAGGDAAANGRDAQSGTPRPTASGPLPGRYVRVEMKRKEYLHFAEVEVYCHGQNVAVKKPARASSTMATFTADKAVDGVVEYVWGKDASLWSSAGQGDQWWELDLGTELAIEKIVFWNRLDCCQERLDGAVLSVLKSDRSLAFKKPLDATAFPDELVFVEQPLPPPVDVTGVPLAQRIAALCPRFDKPSEDPAYVMPVGTGDLSAMVRFGEALHLHLSKTDFAGFGNSPGSYERNICSPGHVRLAFEGVTAASVTKFEQQIDLLRGSVRLALSTATGELHLEVFGVMGTNALLVAIEDGRKTRGVSAEFSIWRPAMSVKAEDGTIVTREVHDYDISGKKPAAPARVPADDMLFNLGSGTVVAFADERGLLTTIGKTGGDMNNQTATLSLASAPSRYWLLIASETSYEGRPEAKARATLAGIEAANKDDLRRRQLDWWDRYWQASSYLDLYGKDAERLMRLWYTTLYSYACVGSGPVLPNFNGGPGLVDRDCRTWGWGYWWQNTRELMWPMYAANHLEVVRAHLDFYDRYFTHYQRATANQGKVGLHVPEGADPLKPGSVPPPRKTSAFNRAALEAAVANRNLENSGGGYTSHIFAQGAELVQQMFEYAAYSGDERFFREVVPPWLHEVTLFHLSYLKRGDDGLYHLEPANAVETWWKVRDPMPAVAGIRYCFWKALAHGADFGYEPEFLAVVRERLEHLAPLPTGRWKVRPVTDKDFPAGTAGIKPTQAVDIERTDTAYAPAGDVLQDRSKHNAENPELYLVYPFALVDFNSPRTDYERAVNTFKARMHPNTYGWSQCGIQASRLRLPETVDVIRDHVRRHQTYPYGGWDNAANRLQGSKLGVSDVPYFDAAGVQMTALQETLLQSHSLSTPAKTDPFASGAIVLLPAVRKDWAGRFKLRARGGFLVEVVFQRNRVIERLTIASERGGALTLANPFQDCRVLQGGKELLTTKDAVVRLPTQKGDVLEFLGSQARNP